jgi:hypothetical protein
MSLNLTQLEDKIDRICGTNSTSYSTANKVVDINLALDEVYSIALKNGGWNLDDYNWTDQPIIYKDLVAGTGSYSFTKDANNAITLGVHKVMVKGTDGVYREITPVDMQGEDAPTTMLDGQNTSGVPSKYDKTGTTIYLDLIPSYSSTRGLKIYVDREASYFVSDASGSQKMAGIDGLCHDYLYLKPAYEYARDNSLDIKETLYRDLLDAKKKVDERYGRREKDTPKIIKARYQNNH